MFLLLCGVTFTLAVSVRGEPTPYSLRGAQGKESIAPTVNPGVWQFNDIAFPVFGYFVVFCSFWSVAVLLV